MITPDYCKTMARYNQWMNEGLYALCAELSDAERKRDRGAFFGSIHATLDHILYGDLALLARFTGDPAEAPQLGVEIQPEFAALRAAREALDVRIDAWAETLTPTWLSAPFRYRSNVDGRTRETPTWRLVVHLFNHQTHHRGQVTTLLSQLGIDPGTTDLPFVPGLAEVLE